MHAFGKVAAVFFLTSLSVGRSDQGAVNNLRRNGIDAIGQLQHLLNNFSPSWLSDQLIQLMAFD